MKTSLIPFLVLFSLATYAQTDSIFLQKEVLVGEIKSIDLTHVHLSQNNSQFPTHVNKLLIKEIRFSTGNTLTLNRFEDTVRLVGKTVLRPRFFFDPTYFVGLQPQQLETATTSLFQRFFKEKQVQKAYKKLENRAILLNCNYVLIHHATAQSITSELYSTSRPSLDNIDTTWKVTNIRFSSVDEIYTKRNRKKIIHQQKGTRLVIEIDEFIERDKKLYASCRIWGNYDFSEKLELLVVDINSKQIQLFRDEGSFLTQYRIRIS